jgi:PAS domain S-box-containing protein
MAHPLNLIIVEDNLADAELLQRQLRRAGFNPTAVRVEREETLRAALRQPVDIVLSDFDMPQFNGLRALEIVRAVSSEIPFILVSGTMGEDIAVEAMKKGASDYLLKDRLARLGQAITAALMQARARKERQALETAIADTEARYRSIFENASEGIFQLDGDHRLLIANPALARMFGWESAGAMTASVADFAQLLCKEDAGRTRLFDTLRSQRSLQGVEICGTRKDGSPIWLSLNARLIGSPDGSRHVDGTVEDISAKKALESQLLRAQRLESVGRLAGGVAHDINNILVPVLMGAGMLRAKTDDPEQQALLDTMEASARRGAAIVKQLLQFSRGASGARVSIKPAALVKDMCDIMRETFPKNITVRSELAAQDLAVVGDPTQLHQILMNLCVNARDAMHDGGELRIGVREIAADPTTKIAAGIQPRSGRYVALSVGDTGCGISPEHLETIFDPFFTTKELGHGTGLGLSTVLGITRSHGGFIQIETAVGRGTTFTVAFPLGAAPDPVRTETAPPVKTTGRSDLVLVVDDEAPVRTVVHRVLVAAGYRCIDASDGAEGVSRFVEHMHEVRLVITDVMMPNMDGVGLLRAVRALDPEVPVVATSGAGGPRKLEALRALGVSGMLQKPFSKDDLLQTVARHIVERAPSGTPTS